jgi:hypothetical protein
MYPLPDLCRLVGNKKVAPVVEVADKQEQKKLTLLQPIQRILSG